MLQKPKTPAVPLHICSITARLSGFNTKAGAALEKSGSRNFIQPLKIKNNKQKNKKQIGLLVGENSEPLSLANRPFKLHRPELKF